MDDVLPVIRAFRELRETWFNYKIRHDGHEREWESEEAQSMREKHNAEMKAMYDMQTELIIKGEKAPISPTCLFDMRI